MVYDHVYIEKSRHICHTVSNALKYDWINMRATELAVWTERGFPSHYFSALDYAQNFAHVTTMWLS